MSAEAPIQDARLSPSPARAWFGVVAAPIAWAVQGLLGWFVSGAGCRNDQSFWGVPLSTLTTVAIVVSVVALVVALGALWLALQDLKQSAEHTNLNAIDGRTRVSYVAASGVLISGVFSVAILWAGIGAILVNPCGQMR